MSKRDRRIRCALSSLCHSIVTAGFSSRLPTYNPELERRAFHNVEIPLRRPRREVCHADHLYGEPSRLGVVAAMRSYSRHDLAAGGRKAQSTETPHISSFRPVQQPRRSKSTRDAQGGWTFGDGSDIPGPHSVVGVNDAQRVGPLTLICRHRHPAGPPGCSDTVNGCPDNRVFLVDQHRHDRVAIRPGRRCAAPATIS